MDICHAHNRPSEQSLLTRLRSLPFIPKVDAFLVSGRYIALLGFLTLLCNAFNLELIVYTIFIAVGLYISFFGRDYLPIIPLVVYCYIAPHISNNPGAYDTSVFYIGHGGLYIIFLAALFAASVIFRLAIDPEIGRRAFFTAPRKLLPGILALGGAYLLAGAFSGHYFDHGTGNLVFAAVQFLAIGLLYYILAGAIKWNKVPRDYLGKTGLIIGMVLVAEIIVMYFITDPFDGGKLDRNVLFTGWGNYNCMGGLLTMMIPFAFQMAIRTKHSWFYSVCGTFFLLGVIMSCSRTSIVVAILIYGASLLYVCHKSKHRWKCITVNALVFGSVFLYMLLYQTDALVSYLKIFTITRSIFSRTDGFEAGIAQFLSAPIFGASFYATDYVLEEWSTVKDFTSFFPGLWHNTIIQIGASCGIVGLAAYSFHRIQTIRLFLKKPSAENIFIGFSLAAMLIMSLFDCHIFNIGPALFYSMALAFAEKHSTKVKR